jgi:hypothetical protein
MGFTTAAKNAALDGMTLNTLSLHTGYPGTTGANEVSGGTPAYARQSATFGAASGGQRTLSSSVTFDVPATTVRWIGVWNGSTFMSWSPNGGTPREFTADPSTDTIRSPAHGYADTQQIVFWDGTVPGGLTEGTVYYVRDATTDTFRVAATSGGSAIDLGAAGTQACKVSAIVQQTYASQSTHRITAYTVDASF